jgi:N-acetylmuramoyl-L-alanine amidase
LKTELIKLRPLAYARHLQGRANESIDLLVIHCTELPDLAMAREYGERILYPKSNSGNSGHFYVDKNGAIEQWVAPEFIAHHVRGFNQRSIGIELVNLGRYPDWFHSTSQQMTEPYPEVQLAALLNLIAELRSTLPSLRWICGHAQLDTEQVSAFDQPMVQVQRKLDPGPCFPWPRVLKECGLEIFPDAHSTQNPAQAQIPG